MLLYLNLDTFKLCLLVMCFCLRVSFGCGDCLYFGLWVCFQLGTCFGLILLVLFGIWL